MSAAASDAMDGTVTRPAMRIAPAEADADGAGFNLGDAGFQIDVVFPDATLTASQQAVFASAADRWERIITGDLPDVPANPDDWGAEVDDLRITATAPAIDGPSGTLGQAGPTRIRGGPTDSPFTHLPFIGKMEFDAADVAALETNGSLSNVILHEIGHVLGVGTIWDLKGVIVGEGSADPRYTGAGALAQYNAIFGQAERSVPVENTGGPGTADAHWRETVFGRELLTGFLNGGVPNPLSRVTAAQFADLGYPGVVLDAADDYIPRTPVVAALSDGPEPTNSDGTVTLTATGVSDPNGVVTSVGFYRETNGAPGLQSNGVVGGTPDELLATDASGADGYAASVPLAGLAPGTYTYYAQATDNGGAQGNFAATTNTVVLPPPTVQSVQLNDGNAQRSKVSSITVTFSQPVVLDAGAITLVGRDGVGASTVLNVAPGTGSSQTFVLTFSGDSIIGGSLADGVYDLTVAAARVHAGAATGTPMAADAGLKFHRLYGDADGDGDVDNSDLFQLRGTVRKTTGDPGYKAFFDYTANGVVDNADLFQIRSRLRVTFKGY